jgi:formylglycine-generating enzyme required for sulfatase activity
MSKQISLNALGLFLLYMRHNHRNAHLYISALIFLIVVISPAFATDEAVPEGMKWIPGGVYTMGSIQEGARRNEQPIHKVSVDGFWLDEHSVTNTEFQKFTDATGYKTTAERPINWDVLKKQTPPGTPKPADEMLQPGSLVFTPTSGPVDLTEMAGWWRWTTGANWRHPEGPQSDLKGREDHPVVQVSWNDALAYATWAGKRLPTEAEWEYAARGGLEGKRFPWGDEFKPGGKFMANIWTGDFPYKNTKEDGFVGTAPVKSFPPNNYGLYDMAGNVWNWVNDFYRPDTHVLWAKEPSCHNPYGPGASKNPRNPYQADEHVTKGGSFLCNVSYCESYRPSARRGTPSDTGMSHIGFRCAKSGPAPAPTAVPAPVPAPASSPAATPAKENP